MKNVNLIDIMRVILLKIAIPISLFLLGILAVVIDIKIQNDPKKLIEDGIENLNIELNIEYICGESFIKVKLTNNGEEECAFPYFLFLNEPGNLFELYNSENEKCGSSPAAPYNQLIYPLIILKKKEVVSYISSFPNYVEIDSKSIFFAEGKYRMMTSKYNSNAIYFAVDKTTRLNLR